MGSLRSNIVVVTAVAAIMTLAAAAGAGGANTKTSISRSAPNVSTPKHGGTLTVLSVGLSMPQLDTATNPDDVVDENENDAIFGDLFQEGPHASIVPSIAQGYQWADKNLEFIVTLRHGVKFEDGSPVNASAIAFNWQRDLLPSNACLCLGNFAAVSSVTTKGDYQVIMHLSVPYAPLALAFLGEAPNWPESPTAFKSASLTAWELHPIGAGPFEIQSFTPNTSLVLVKNPHYFQKGVPYLNQITWTATASDNSDYDALTTGQAQVAGISTFSLIEQIKQQKTLNLSYSPLPPTNVPPVEQVNFNSRIAPFNNIYAREAIAYATNVKQLDASLYNNLYPLSESPTSAGTSFFEKKVPTFLSYNPTKAKQAMMMYTQQTGQPFPVVQLSVLGNSPTSGILPTALEDQWAQVGIQANFTEYSTPAFIARLQSGNWSIWLMIVIGVGTDAAFGLPGNVGSTGLFSGVTDPALNGDLQRAAELVSPSTRQRLYNSIFSYIDKQVYELYMWQSSGFVMTAKNVEGFAQAYSSNESLYWANVWLK